MDSTDQAAAPGMMGRWRTPPASRRPRRQLAVGTGNLRGRGHVVRHRGGHRVRALGHGGRQVRSVMMPTRCWPSRTDDGATTSGSGGTEASGEELLLAHDHELPFDVEQAVTLWVAACRWRLGLLGPAVAVDEGESGPGAASPQVVPA